MKINLNITGFNGYVEVTENSYDLYKITVNNYTDSKGVKSPKYGQEVESILGFFKDFGSAVNKAVQVSLASREERLSLEQFVEEYKSAKESLLQLAQ